MRSAVVASIALSRTAINFSVALCATATLLSADTLELTNGDLLHGTIIEHTDHSVALNHPMFGRLEVPVDQVKALLVTPVEQAPPNVAAGPFAPNVYRSQQPVSPKAAALVTAEVEPTPLIQRILPGWDKRFELGFNGGDSNSQTLNLNSRFIASHEDDRDRIKLDSAYYRSQDDVARTRNEYTSKVVRDWLLPDSPWFYFTDGKYEYNEFRDWEHRTSGFLGVGNQLRDGSKWELVSRTGLGGSYEFGTVEEPRSEASQGLESNYQINDRQMFTAYATVFTDINARDNSRTLSGFSWTIKLDHANGLHLKLGLDDEYESVTEGDTDHNDVKYYGAMVFEF